MSADLDHEHAGHAAEIAELRATVEFLTDRLHRHHWLLSELVKGWWFGEFDQFGRNGYHLSYLRGEFTWSPEEQADTDDDLGWCPPPQSEVAS